MEKPDFWENIKVGAREGLEVLKEELSKVTQELEKQGKIIRKKMDLSSIQRKVHQSFSRLGSRLYELIEEGKEKTVLTDPEILKTVADIKVFKAEVEAIEDEIIRIKEEGTPKKPEADKGQAKTPTDKEKTTP
jgi:hypothetical protein